MSSLKICKVCAVEKKTNPDSSLSDFRKTSGKKKDGTPYFRRICKPCENKRLADDRTDLDKFAKASNDKEVIKAKQHLQEVRIKWNLIQKELRKAERVLAGLKRGLDSQKEFNMLSGNVPPPPPTLDNVPPPPQISEGWDDDNMFSCDLTEGDIDFLVERELVPERTKKMIQVKNEMREKQLEGGKLEYEIFKSGLARGMSAQEIAEFDHDDE